MAGAEERGQAYILLLAAAMLVLAGMFIAVMQMPVSNLLTEAKSLSQTESSTQGIEWVELNWEWLPLTVLLLLIVMVVAAAIHQSRRPG